MLAEENLVLSRLKSKEKISYGLGDLASNLAWAMTSSFLLFFYTNVFLVPVAAAGAILLIARVMDAVADPLMGSIIDKTNSKFGKARPYLLYLSIPFGVLCVLTFTAPNLTDTGKVIYASLTFLVLGLLYTGINIPYGTLMPMMTRDSKEKMQLSSLRTAGMAVGAIIVNAATMPLVNKLGGGNQKVGFMVTMAIYAVLSILLYLVVFANCKERYSDSHKENKENINFFSAVKLASKNKHWTSSLLFAFFMFVRLGIVTSITIYYCIYVIKNPSMISILLPLLYVSSILTSFIATPFLKKFGNKNGNIIGLVISIVIYAVLPFLEGNKALFLILYLICWSIGGLGFPSIFVMIADSVDFHQWKFGKRTEGILYAGYSFSTKVGIAVGGAIIAYALTFSGFNPQAPTGEVINIIRILYYAGPIAASLIQIICILPYGLDKLHPQIVEELNRQ